jgi:hypothetical protein
MLHAHPWAAGFGLLALTLAACTTAPPPPLADDHPASINAPAAPVHTEPSALTAYRDFTAGSPPASEKAPAMDHSMHMPHGNGEASSEPSRQEGGHAAHQ